MAVAGTPSSSSAWSSRRSCGKRFEAVIERATGRHVVGFMSGNQQDPDMICELFILAPTDLVGDDELSADRRR